MQILTREGFYEQREIERRTVSGAAPLGGAGIITDPSAIPPFPGYGRQIAGVPVNAESALQVPAVFAAIRVICFVFGKMGNPYACTEELSDDNVPYHVRLPVQPSILTDTFGGDVGGLMCYDGRNRTVASMALFGEAWWYTLETDRLGRPMSVEPLNPLWLDIKDDHGVRTFLYGIGSSQIKLDPAKLHHVPLLASAGGMRGLSSVRYLGVMMGLALASLEFGSLFFAQGASPSFVLSTDQKVSEENAQGLIERFLVQHAGLNQAHLPLLLDQGLKAQKIQATPDESQYNQTLTSSYESIAGWFGVPPYLLGIMTERGNAYGVGATEELMRRFTQTCLSGYITALEEALSRMLPSGVSAHFNAKRLVQPDAQALAQLLMAQRQGQFITQNEGRIELGLPPKPGGDDLTTPLASNTAPSQTDNAPDSEPKPDAPAVKPADDAQQRELERMLAEIRAQRMVPGPAGPPGAVGRDGREGRAGKDGDHGRDGSDGKPGEQGPQGEPGPEGPQGPTGPQGPSGTSGERGADGKDGAPGPIGRKGDPGGKGERGEKGDTGTPGTPGERGEIGPIGRQGIRGDKGAEGEKGDVGARGLPGQDGQPGKIGRQGERGAAGVDGQPGKDGTDGTDGQRGSDGLRGADGKPGRPGIDADPAEVAERLREPVRDDLRASQQVQIRQEVSSEFHRRDLADDNK